MPQSFRGPAAPCNARTPKWHPGHPVFWLLVAAVVAPPLAEIPVGFRVPVVVVRGLPVALLYRKDLTYAERMPFALSSTAASMSIIVVITEISVSRGRMGTDVAAALVGAALLSVLLFPTIAGIMLSRRPPAIELPTRSAP